MECSLEEHAPTTATMTVLEYLLRPDHLRFVVAGPVLAEGPDREMTAVVLSAHATEEAAKEAVRWERDKLRREIHDRHAVVDLVVVDLDGLDLPQAKARDEETCAS